MSFEIQNVFFGMAVPMSALFTLSVLCPKYGISRDAALKSLAFTATAAAYGGHWLALWMHPSNGESWFSLKQGFSSLGVILGTMGAILLCARYYKIESMRAFALGMEGLIIAMCCFRAGCAWAQDHLGFPTDSFLGAEDFAGVRRHNLGLYEFLFLATILVPYIFLNAWRPPQPRRTIFVLFGGYLFFRLFADSQRADPRWLHLTPMQWASVGVFAFGAAVAAAAAALGISQPTGRG